MVVVMVLVAGDDRVLLRLPQVVLPVVISTSLKCSSPERNPSLCGLVITTGMILKRATPIVENCVLQSQLYVAVADRPEQEASIVASAHAYLSMFEFVVTGATTHRS